MRCTITFLCLTFLFTFTGCVNDHFEQPSPKEDLIEKLIRSEEGQAALFQGKVVVLKKEYCMTEDCEAFFEKSKDQVRIYSLPDAFMSGISGGLIIHAINMEKGEIVVETEAGLKVIR